MSSALLLNMPVQPNGYRGQDLQLDPRIPASTTLSDHTSSNEESSISEVMSSNTAESDSGILDSLDIRKINSNFHTPETSPCVTVHLASSENFPSLTAQDHTIAPDVKIQRQSAPPPSFAGLQDAFLRFIEPNPVAPPSYDLLPPGGCPRYPVMDSSCFDEKLPHYTPAAYKLGVVCRKLEWLSPYEPSPVRSWKTYVVELNSTQLNFYHIPSSIESCLLNFATNYSSDEGSQVTNTGHYKYKSVVTKSQDIQFQLLCGALNFFQNEDKHFEDDDEGYSSSASMTSVRSTKCSKNKRLVRSYSLQHARIGLASDYTKKSNCLRLRLESEQFLLNFVTSQDLIDWHLGLSMGRDVAMDLTERDVPRYRTVPRRRRARVVGSTAFYQESIARRNRTSSDSQFEVSNGLRGKLHSFKRRLSALSLNHLKINSQGQKSAQILQMLQVLEFRQAVKASMVNMNAPVGSLSSLSIQRESNRHHKETRSHSAVSFSLEDYDYEVGLDSQISPVISHLSGINEPNDDDAEDDIQNMSDLHRSDDEDDDPSDLDFSNDGSIGNRSRRSTIPSCAFKCPSDHKWDPSRKPESARRFTRNCLKCIKPLAFDELWVNKLLMKPTVVAPLSQVYLRCRYFSEEPSSQDFSFTTLASMSIRSATDLASISNQGDRRKSTAHKDSLFSFSDTSLVRTTNHHLKEYYVGSHSLIPKDI